LEVFRRVSGLVEQVLRAASLHNNSLCFLAGVASEVHSADELSSMGLAKVLLENYIVGSHERRRRESSELVSLLL
jgi:hypothetical protein